MQLYTVSFTTKKLVKKFDEKGKKIISEKELASPIVMTALPHKAAMQYSGCDNFKIEPYVPDQHGRKASASRAGVGNGTRNVDWTKQSTGANSSAKKSKAAAPTETAAQKAARTGDMSAAVNG